MRPLDDDTESEERELWLFDFDPLRVRKEITDRQNETAPYKASRRGERGFLRRLLFDAFEDGSIDGIKLVTQEDHFPPDEQLETEIKVGSKLPYMLTAVPFGAEIPLIDGERIVGLVSVICPLSVVMLKESRRCRATEGWDEPEVSKQSAMSWSSEAVLHAQRDIRSSRRYAHLPCADISVCHPLRGY